MQIRYKSLEELSNRKNNKTVEELLAQYSRERTEAIQDIFKSMNAIWDNDVLDKPRRKYK